jgi:hypothetical protein
MRPNRTLLSTISDQAAKTYAGDHKDVQAWMTHWLEVAEAIRADFIAQGLTVTADAVSTLIEWNKKYATTGEAQ